jgi:3-methyl-2-oxobutanoate hydroxymethyltransferase
VFEAIPAAITETLMPKMTIPVIGIGAGGGTDGQVLVYHDLLGLSEGHLPRFVKRYANLSGEIRDALTAYAAEVRSRAFPDEQHTYAMPKEEQAAFERASD